MWGPPTATTHSSMLMRANALCLLVCGADRAGSGSQLGDEPFAHAGGLNDAVAAIAQCALDEVGGEHAGPGASDIQHDDEVVLALGHRVTGFPAPGAGWVGQALVPFTFERNRYGPARVSLICAAALARAALVFAALALAAALAFAELVAEDFVSGLPLAFFFVAALAGTGLRGRFGCGRLGSERLGERRAWRMPALQRRAWLRRKSSGPAAYAFTPEAISRTT